MKLVKGLRSQRSELPTSYIKRRPPHILVDTTETCANDSCPGAALRVRASLNSAPQETCSPHPIPSPVAQVSRYLKKPAEGGKGQGTQENLLLQHGFGNISPLVRKHTVACGEWRSYRVSRDHDKASSEPQALAPNILLNLLLLSELEAGCTCSPRTEPWVLCSHSPSWKWQKQVLEQNWLAPRPSIFSWVIPHLAASRIHQRPSDNHLLPQGPPLKPRAW